MFKFFGVKCKRYKKTLVLLGECIVVATLRMPKNLVLLGGTVEPFGADSASSRHLLRHPSGPFPSIGHHCGPGGQGINITVGLVAKVLCRIIKVGRVAKV